MFRMSLSKRKVPLHGMHGYDPELADMKGIFLAWGDSVAKGVKLKSLDAVAVAPAVSRALKIQPPKDNVGRLPEEMFGKN